MSDNNILDLDSPQPTLVRHILLALSQYQWEEVVFNLSVARERKKKKINYLAMLL